MADRLSEYLMGLSGITGEINETHAALGNAAAGIVDLRQQIVRLGQQLVEIQAQIDARPNITVEEHQQLRRYLAAAQVAVAEQQRQEVACQQAVAQAEAEILRLLILC